jgi:hypothetical protein
VQDGQAVVFGREHDQGVHGGGPSAEPDLHRFPPHGDDPAPEHLRQTTTSVEVTGRREIGSAEAPGLTQTLAVSAVVGGVPRSLIQSQDHLSMLDVAHPRKLSVIRLVLTDTAPQHPAVLDDLRDFAHTDRPDIGAATA